MRTRENSMGALGARVNSLGASEIIKEKNNIVKAKEFILSNYTQ